MLKPRAGLEYDAYAFPGGYGILYLACMSFDGEPDRRGGEYPLCSDCASKAYREALLLGLYGDDGEYSPDDFVTVGFLHEEGPPMFCERCNAEMESEYGDPEADES